LGALSNNGQRDVQRVSKMIEALKKDIEALQAKQSQTPLNVVISSELDNKTAEQSRRQQLLQLASAITTALCGVGITGYALGNL